MADDRLDREMQALMRATYMRREYGTVLSASSELQGLVFAPQQLTRHDSDTWAGVIFIRSQKSPWFRGAFSFAVTFPPAYPQECPIARFDTPLPSHPLLKADHRTVPFEAEFMTIGRNQVSVMLRLLKFIRSIFSAVVLENRGVEVDRGLCRSDVDRASVTAVDATTRAYAKLLTEDMHRWVMEARAPQGAGANRTAVVNGADNVAPRSTASAAAPGEEAAAKMPGPLAALVSGFASFFTHSFVPELAVAAHRSPQRPRPT